MRLEWRHETFCHFRIYLPISSPLISSPFLHHWICLLHQYVTHNGTASIVSIAINVHGHSASDVAG